MNSESNFGRERRKWGYEMGQEKLSMTILDLKIEFFSRKVIIAAQFPTRKNKKKTSKRGLYN